MDLQKLNLNRSFSEPDFPSCSYFRRLTVEECYQPQSSNNLTIKYYSSSQIIDKSMNGSISIQNTYLEADNSGISDITDYLQKRDILAGNITCLSTVLCNNIEKQIDKENYTLQENKNFQSEKEHMPMDIDNEEVEEYSENEDIKERVPESNIYFERKRPRRLNENFIRQKRNDDKNKINYLKIIVSLSVVIIACWYFSTSAKITQEKNDIIQEIRHDFSKILYQDHVKDVTIKNLNYLRENMMSKKILVFVGSTGVGKTYMVNLIRKHFPKDYTLDVNFLWNVHLNVDNIKAYLRSDGCYFIIIDDLKIDNLKDVMFLINKLPNSCMLIVPIFNIHDVDDNLVYSINYNNVEKIKQEFTKTFPAQADVVLFNTITRDTLEMWLKDQVTLNGLSNIEEEITSLLDEHDISIHGFKGLSAKLNVLRP